MPLSPEQAIDTARTAHELHVPERERLDVVRRYWKGRQALPMVIPLNSPSEMKVMAAASRVNVLPIVVNSLVQSAFVDGFRPPDQDASGDPDGPGAELWRVWQRNRWDARQSAVHRAAAAYGSSYVVVTPGDPVPVMRAVSPRSMCAVYGEDPDWPMWALERTSDKTWKLYDEEAVYFLRGGDAKWLHLETRTHNAGVTPVVRFRDEEDLDDEDEPESQVLTTQGALANSVPVRGQIAPLMALQDQIDLTTFDLQVAQHFGAFKQRYIIGWAADTEVALLKTAANRLVTLDVKPEDVKIGEWSATDVKQYIDSRESSLRHAASLSQTPIHELTGDIVNLSAEALAAAEAGKERKVDERQTLWGESHEQALWLAGRYLGIDVPDDAQVIWRDTSARAFAATVDGLGKLATMLGVPSQELWERIPGVTQQDVERWRTSAASGDAFGQLASMLDRQARESGVPGAAA